MKRKPISLLCEVESCAEVERSNGKRIQGLLGGSQAQFSQQKWTLTLHLKIVHFKSCPTCRKSGESFNWEYLYFFELWLILF